MSPMTLSILLPCDVVILEHTQWQRQCQVAASAARMLVNGDAIHDAWNGGGGVDFGASQCIQWNQFYTATTVWSFHTLNDSFRVTLFIDVELQSDV